ncbi:TVG1228987 [Thermoplasma volcanium GSS1]|uniref:TVG1228987 protein n=1 Tax=Thermoplasma volcanium (strain ATCC 51530 / DSM 4299 / JCM 9571 / NBRC 15438 / GSS1) TaxID=273116 RepID=Q979G2_THEVO|nr:hypothetical protein [Thermoplasma volcanium]BAB60341.1 TVG1228987 [Thermoplasma volcanium GSS1]
MSWCEFQVGAGKVLVDENITSSLNGKYILLTTRVESGPCLDGMCQVIRELQAEIVDRVSENLLFFGNEKVKIAMDKSVYNSINKGREEIKLKYGRGYKLFVSGFSYVT